MVGILYFSSTGNSLYIAKRVQSRTGGYLSGKFRMDAFAESIRNTGAFFGTHIAPWLTVAVAVIVPAICIPIYRNLSVYCKEAMRYTKAGNKIS